jgi:phosphatidylglycerol:prolipoprotein diacylglycerol transferase
VILFYPNINPVIFSVGVLKIHWYAVMYLAGFFFAWLLANYRVKKYHLNWTSEQISDLIFYAAIGVILGGRIGYMLFYDTATWLERPLDLFKIWQGGMSFHGGFLGVFVALWFFARKAKKPFWELTDFMAPLVPIGLAFGRIGNFINGELWGRPTDIPNWGMIFPYVDMQPRHPSQLYECFFEGLLLFIIMWLYTSKPRPCKAASGVFLMGYGVFRFFLEFLREPDVGIGYLWHGWLTMGQLLSIPMVLVGLLLLILAYRGENHASIP